MLGWTGDTQVCLSSQDVKVLPWLQKKSFPLHCPVNHATLVQRAFSVPDLIAKCELMALSI